MDFKDNIGELLNLDILTSHNNHSIDLIYYKTSSLFIFAFILGGIYSNTNNINIDEFKKMGEYLGLMYQIMDDSNDIDTDESHKNIVLSYGSEKSLQLYRDAETKLVELLLKYNLMTSTFEKLISKLNQKLKF
jgi:geranylgeranyl pyrophosphate synthase